MSARARRCPYCGSLDVRRLAYGLPTSEAINRADADGIEYAGCVLTGDEPQFRCRTCGVSWPDTSSRLHDRFAIPRIAWPFKLAGGAEPSLLADLIEGSLLWGAVGDALGRANERRHNSTIGQPGAPGYVRDYQPWAGWRNGPIGTITDDTQLTMVVAQSVVAAGGSIDPENFARRLVRWLPIARGAGQATRAAVSMLVDGRPWWDAGPAIESSGNGAAMRSAPIALAHVLDPDPRALLRLAVGYALPTHSGPVGVAGAVAMAAGVAYAMRTRLDPGRVFSRVGFLEFVAAAIAGIEREPTPERRRDSPGPAFLRDRILELGPRLDDDPEAVLAWTWTGAFALESVPAAMFCFLRSPDDPTEVLLAAANTSHDTDTIASMAGNLVGSMVGAVRLRDEQPTWWREMEDRDVLRSLAGELGAIARGPDGDSQPR